MSKGVNVYISARGLFFFFLLLLLFLRLLLLAHSALIDSNNSVQAVKAFTSDDV